MEARQLCEIEPKSSAVHDVLQFLGYRFNAYGKGACCGIAMLSIELFLRYGMQGIVLMESYLSFIHEDSKNKYRIIKKIKHKKDALFSRTPYNIDHKSKVKKLFTMEEIHFLTFCDRITIYQTPEIHDELFNAIYTQRDIEKISSLISYKEENTIVNADSWPGIYSTDEILSYLIILTKIAKNRSQNIGLSLSCIGHQVNICFDYKSANWLLINSGNPIQYFHETSLTLLSLTIQNAFLTNLKNKERFETGQFQTGFITTVITTKINMQDTSNYLEDLKKSDIFKSIHAITEERAQYQTVHGFTLTTYAIRGGYSESLKELVKLKIDLNNTESLFGSLAYSAAQSGNVKIMKILAKAKVNLNQDVKQFTPACIAARVGHVAILQVLARYGVDLSLPAPCGKTPLDIAKQCNQKEVIKFLMRYQKEKIEMQSYNLKEKADKNHFHLFSNNSVFSNFNIQNMSDDSLKVNLCIQSNN